MNTQDEKGKLLKLTQEERENLNRPITSKQIELEIVFQNSLAVQWLRLGAFTAVGSGLIPGWETKIPPARQGSHKKKKKKKRIKN